MNVFRRDCFQQLLAESSNRCFFLVCSISRVFFFPFQGVLTGQGNISEFKGSGSRRDIQDCKFMHLRFFFGFNTEYGAGRIATRWIDIDYYMLRAWYRFYSRVFNTISRTSEFTKFDASRQRKSKIKRGTRLVQPNYYNLFDWTIQSREVIYHFTSEMISYHFTGISFIHGFITLISTHNM